MVSRQKVSSDNESLASLAAWSLRHRGLTLVPVSTSTAEATYRKRLGDAIVQLRTLRGITQATLAERVNRSEAALSRWETGKATPSAFDLVMLAEILDAPADLLLSPPESPVSPIAERLRASAEAGAQKGLSRAAQKRGAA
jgi:transcriptional regulator with XRE-family HTH domain